MISTGEIARGMQGALALLKRDPAAPSYFDNTLEACVRSFQVMILVAPLHVTLMLLRYASITSTADDLEIVLVEALRYIVDWLLFPVLFYEIARRRNWLGNYPRYVSALNWVNLPAMIVAVIGLVLATLMPPLPAELIRIGLQALFFYWFLVTTRTMLGVGWPVATLLLVVNWVPSLFMSLIVDRFLGIALVAGA
ncbi:hypothetical protein [Reyranella sp.]|uniref:hypothetical protein n=1 Tax=Reyranella sp. TaxID=1929291 RepID=UPI003D139ED8